MNVRRCPHGDIDVDSDGCVKCIRAAAFAEGERAGRIAAFKEGGHALVGVARAYREKYGKAVENIVCLPLADGIRCLRELSDRATKAKGGAP